jgi:hypothetical protein
MVSTEEKQKIVAAYNEYMKTEFGLDYTAEYEEGRNFTYNTKCYEESFVEFDRWEYGCSEESTKEDLEIGKLFTEVPDMIHGELSGIWHNMIVCREEFEEEGSYEEYEMVICFLIEYLIEHYPNSREAIWHQDELEGVKKWKANWKEGNNA